VGKTVSSHDKAMTSPTLLSPGCSGTLCRKQHLNRLEMGEVRTASPLGPDPGTALHWKALPLQYLWGWSAHQYPLEMGWRASFHLPGAGGVGWAQGPSHSSSPEACPDGKAVPGDGPGLALCGRGGEHVQLLTERLMLWPQAGMVSSWWDSTGSRVADCHRFLSHWAPVWKRWFGGIKTRPLSLWTSGVV